MAKRVIRATAVNDLKKIEITIKINFASGEFFHDSVKATAERVRNGIYDLLRNHQFHNSQIKIK